MLCHTAVGAVTFSDINTALERVALLVPATEELMIVGIITLLHHWTILSHILVRTPHFLVYISGCALGRNRIAEDV